MIELGIEEARRTMNEDKGGPFGAVMTRNGKVITVASNTVLSSHDASAHAEINAIRKAGKILGKHDLSDCEIYTTGYPCPMCLSAIIWANIKKVYYGTNLDDAKEIGFRDEFIYEHIKNNGLGELIEFENIEREKCLELFKEYKDSGKEIY